MRQWSFSHLPQLAVIVLLAACSTHYSTLEDPSSKQAVLYTMSENEALELAHSTIVASFPGRVITTLDGPTKGYSTYTRVLLDTYSQQILVIPAIGKAASGDPVEGYYFEISGSGSSGTGMMRNHAFAESLRTSLARSGKGVPVTEVQIRQPTATAAEPSQPPASTSTDAQDPLAQIERLKALLDKGAITPQEYETKKAELMKRI